MMPVKKSAKNDVSNGAFARLQHNSRYSLEFDVGLDETSPTYGSHAWNYTQIPLRILVQLSNSNTVASRLKTLAGITANTSDALPVKPPALVAESEHA